MVHTARFSLDRSLLLMPVVARLEPLIETTTEVRRGCPVHVTGRSTKITLPAVVLKSLGIAGNGALIETKPGPFLLRREIVLEG